MLRTLSRNSKMAASLKARRYMLMSLASLCDDTVTTFKTDEDKEITMTVVDDSVLKERAY